jgi:heme oxygenase
VSGSLAARLRQDTKSYHTEAERSGIMRRLLTRSLDKDTYIALLQNLVPVYTALETELTRHMKDPRIAPFYHPGLARSGALVADIATLGGNPADADRPTAAAQAYATSIHAAATEDPVLLIAHSYVRYLGDLSGGQILKKMIAEMYGLEGTAGVSFYEFPDLPAPEAYKHQYRAALDRVDLTETQANKVVDEAIEAFKANSALFRALEGAVQR